MKALFRSIMPYFSTKKQHPTSQKSSQEQYILLTYRSGIQKTLPSTYYTSDSGWGCMLRVGQMFIANLYYKIEQKPIQQVIRLFYDNNKSMVFCLPLFTETAAHIYPHKKQYQWFSPCECGFIIKELLDNFDTKFRTSICNDNCIFLNEISQDRDTLVIMVMCRIGLDQPQPEYLQCVLELMKLQHFNCIMGGTPKRAHLFLKNVDGYLGFLDPHQTQKVPPFQQLLARQKQYVSKLLWIKQEYIDCSMSIVFVVKKQEIMKFWESLEKVKEKIKEGFFIYMEKQRPVYNSDEIGIVQLSDDEQFQQYTKQKEKQQQKNQQQMEKNQKQKQKQQNSPQNN